MVVSQLNPSCYVTPKTKKEADDMEYNECAKHSIRKSMSPLKKGIVPFNPLQNSKNAPSFGFGCNLSIDEESWGQNASSFLKESQSSYDNSGGVKF